VRERAVPTELQGRVASVNTVGVFGGLVIGSSVGGVLAQLAGITAPFWFAFAGSAVFLTAIWTQLAHIAHGDLERVRGLAPTGDATVGFRHYPRRPSTVPIPAISRRPLRGLWITFAFTWAAAPVAWDHWLRVEVTLGRAR